jgi:hypothetical protein
VEKNRILFLFLFIFVRVSILMHRAEYPKKNLQLFFHFFNFWLGGEGGSFLYLFFFFFFVWEENICKVFWIRRESVLNKSFGVTLNFVRIR